MSELGVTLRAAFLRFDLRPNNGRVLVACSGGPDSRTLLELLVDNAVALGLDLQVAAVDHGVRAAAAAECEAVLATAAAHKLPAVVLRLPTPPRSMAAARAARYDALVAHAQSIGAGAIAVGHTATDQAETLLDRLLRGAGARGLGAMAPRRAAAEGVALIRPLLAVSRADIDAFVTARGLAVAVDPTNTDARFRRSRLRAEVLPLLRRERADADVALAATAERLRADDEALEVWAARVPSDGNGVQLGALEGLPSAVIVRVLRRLAGPLSSVHVDALMALISTSDGSASIDLPGQRALRVYERLSFASPSTPAPIAAVEITGPGAYRLGAVEVVISDAAWLRWGPMQLRPPCPGDRLAGRHKKLKRLLIDRKVPRHLRAELPTLVRGTTLGGETVWVAESPPPPRVLVP